MAKYVAQVVVITAEKLNKREVRELIQRRLSYDTTDKVATGEQVTVEKVIVRSVDTD